MKFKRTILIIMVAAMFLSILASCGKDNNVNSGSESGSEVLNTEPSEIPTESLSDDVSVPADGVDYRTKDSSDLPTWSGKQLKINYWRASGTGGDRSLSPNTKDVVDKEITRVTGVTVDEDNSFDNGGQSYKAKLQILSTSKTFPTIAMGVQDLSQLVNTGRLYDLTKYIKDYAPNLQKFLDDPKFMTAYRGQVPSSTKNFTLPYRVDQATYAGVKNIQIDGSYFNIPQDPSDGMYFYCRDDVLKMIFPQAKTYAQIEDLYVKNGVFTKAECIDVSIKDKDGFLKFLRDIKNLNLKEDGKQVYPIFLSAKQDAWAVMSMLKAVLNGEGYGSNYFQYWNKQKKSMDLLLVRPEFKEDLKYFNSMTREGLTDQACFVETYEQTMGKLHRGQYAISYAFLEPNNKVVEESGKSFRFRKVYMDREINSDVYIKYNGGSGGGGYSAGQQIVVFKAGIAEADLPQLMKWYDYCLSEEGLKNFAWGPRDAGLFIEKEGGKREFKDPKVSDFIIKGEGSRMDAKQYFVHVDYAQWPTKHDRFQMIFVECGRSEFSPAYSYSNARQKRDANMAFNWGGTEPIKPQPNFTKPECWNFTGLGSQMCDDFWSARRTMEDPMESAIAAGTDAKFEAEYNTMISNARSAGWGGTVDDVNDPLIKEFNRINREYINAGEKFQVLLNLGRQ